MFFESVKIGYEYVSVVIYPTNLNSLGRCILCVYMYQGKISAVVGHEPDTSWASQWANLAPQYMNNFQNNTN